MTRPRAEIVNLTSVNLEEAARVLAAAFYHSPLANYVLSHLGDDFPVCLHGFFRFTCEIRLELDEPFFGVIRSSQLEGVACLTLPESPEWPPSLVEKHQHLKARMGPQGSDRLERYAEIVGRNTTREPHYFFGVLGVHPRAQGQGLSSLLINQAHALCESHATATGMALDTDTPTNVSIYEHFGYRVTVQEPLDHLTVYCMFRPNGATGKR